MRSFLFPALLAAVVPWLVGCGDNTGTEGGANTACPGGLNKVPNTEFCAASASPVDCSIVTSETNALCGVALKDAPAELARASGLKEFSGSGAPDLGCFAPAGYPAKPSGAPKKVTITGYAKIFSDGCESHDVDITVYAVKANGELGDKVGQPVTTASDCKVDGKQEMVDKCVDGRWECKYEYADVPSDTQLVILTDGADWAPLYDYNVYVASDEIDEATMTWAHDVRAVAQNDYGTIPTVAYGSQITSGRGVVAGEVHDCGNIRVQNAVVNVNVDKVFLTYFTNDEDHPLPQSGENGTSKLGLYAAFDIDPGPVTVAAAGLVNGKMTTVGYFQAYVFADAITAVTFRGLRPFQLP